MRWFGTARAQIFHNQNISVGIRGVSYLAEAIDLLSCIRYNSFRVLLFFFFCSFSRYVLDRRPAFWAVEHKHIVHDKWIPVVFGWEWYVWRGRCCIVFEHVFLGFVRVCVATTTGETKIPSGLLLPIGGADRNFLKVTRLNREWISHSRTHMDITYNAYWMRNSICQFDNQTLE